jgi:uncharacterized membrane protein YhfC
MDFKKKVLIATGIATVLAIGLGIFVYIKKKNNADWKLLKLPAGVKSNRKIIINRTN